MYIAVTVSWNSPDIMNKERICGLNRTSLGKLVCSIVSPTAQNIDGVNI